MFESYCMEFEAKFVMADQLVIWYVFNAFDHLSEEIDSDIMTCKFILN